MLNTKVGDGERRRKLGDLPLSFNFLNLKSYSRILTNCNILRWDLARRNGGKEGNKYKLK